MHSVPVLSLFSLIVSSGQPRLFDTPFPPLTNPQQPASITPCKPHAKGEARSPKPKPHANFYDFPRKTPHLARFLHTHTHKFAYLYLPPLYTFFQGIPMSKGQQGIHHKAFRRKAPSTGRQGTGLSAGQQQARCV